MFHFLNHVNPMDSFFTSVNDVEYLFNFVMFSICDIMENIDGSAGVFLDSICPQTDKRSATYSTTSEETGTYSLSGEESQNILDIFDDGCSLYRRYREPST